MAKPKEKNRPTPRQPTETLLEWHLRELNALISRLEANNLARPTIEARIIECRRAINA